LRRQSFSTHGRSERAVSAVGAPAGARGGRYSRALVASSRGRAGSGSLQLVVDHRRRIRRPFTVQEVAVLVDAVETLGSKELEVAPLTSAWYAPAPTPAACVKNVQQQKNSSGQTIGKGLQRRNSSETNSGEKEQQRTP